MKDNVGHYYLITIVFFSGTDHTIQKSDRSLTIRSQVTIITLSSLLLQCNILLNKSNKG